MPITSPLRELVDLKLGRRGGVDQWLIRQRAKGRTWRQISKELERITQVDVTEQTLRSWMPDPEEDD